MVGVRKEAGGELLPMAASSSPWWDRSRWSAIACRRHGAERHEEQEEGGTGMKRGMVAVLLVVLLASTTWATQHWYRYQGAMSMNTRGITGQTGRKTWDVDVLIRYETTPHQISFQAKDSDFVYWSGDCDVEGTKLYLRAEGNFGEETFVGRGSFNAKQTSLNLQAQSYYQWFTPGSRASSIQYRFRGQFVNIVTKP
jgi:hypothetical protein